MTMSVPTFTRGWALKSEPDYGFVGSVVYMNEDAARLAARQLFIGILHGPFTVVEVEWQEPVETWEHIEDFENYAVLYPRQGRVPFTSTGLGFGNARLMRRVVAPGRWVETSHSPAPTGA